LNFFKLKNFQAIHHI